MTRISSPAVWFWKKVFPLAWCVILAVCVLALVQNGMLMRAAQPFRVLPLIIAAFGLFILKKYVWDLVDEVFDCGDTLLVRKGRREVRIALSEIREVVSAMNQSPQRLTLRLQRPGPFGSDVAFLPAGGGQFNPFATHPLATDLRDRAEQARRAALAAGQRPSTR